MANINITMIDLDAPPPFVRVLKDLSETYEIAHKPTQGISHWIHRPDWGTAAGFFDRRASYRNVAGMDIPIRKPSPALYDHDDAMGPLFGRFAENLVDICGQIERATCLCTENNKFLYVRDGKFDSTDVHFDSVGFMRMFLATEHGNVVLPDTVAAQAAGFAFGDSHVTTEALSAAGVPLYTAPLGCITLWRQGENNILGPAGWHAEYKIPRDSGARPCFRQDFHHPRSGLPLSPSFLS